MDKKSKINTHWEWLQSIRGGGGLAVLIFHIWLFFRGRFDLSNNILDFICLEYFDLGKIGVVLFFIISGYLLPYSLKNKTKSEFIRNRFFRLYPTYWFSMVLALIFVGGFGIKQVLGNITMFQLFFNIKDMVGAYWTLPIELLLYIGCLLFFRYLFKVKFIYLSYFSLLFFTVMISLLRYQLGTKLPVAIFLLLTISVLGYCIRLYKEKELNMRMFKYILISFIVFLIPITYLAYSMDLGRGEIWYRYFNSYSIAVFIFLIAWRYQLNCKLFNFFGKISYSMYLTHGVLISTFPKVAHFFPNLYIAAGSLLIVSLLLAIVTYYFIEETSFNFYKKILLNRKKQ